MGKHVWCASVIIIITCHHRDLNLPHADLEIELLIIHSQSGGMAFNPRQRLVFPGPIKPAIILRSAIATARLTCSTELAELVEYMLLTTPF